MDLQTLYDMLGTLLEDRPDAGSMPIRMAFQPSWPLRFQLNNVRVDRMCEAQGGEGGLCLILGTCNVPDSENPYGKDTDWDSHRCLTEEFSTLSCTLSDDMLDKIVELAIRQLGLGDDVSIDDVGEIADGRVKVFISVDSVGDAYVVTSDLDGDNMDIACC